MYYAFSKCFLFYYFSLSIVFLFLRKGEERRSRVDRENEKKAKRERRKKKGRRKGRNEGMKKGEKGWRDKEIIEAEKRPCYVIIRAT